MATCSDDASQATAEVSSGDSLQGDQEESFSDSASVPKQEGYHRQQFARRAPGKSNGISSKHYVPDAQDNWSGGLRMVPPPNAQCFGGEGSIPFLMPYSPIAMSHGLMLPIPILSHIQDSEPGAFNQVCLMPMSPSQGFEQYEKEFGPISSPMSPAMSSEQVEAHLIANLPECYED